MRDLQRRFATTPSAKLAASTTTPLRSMSTCRTTARPMRSCDSEQTRLAGGAGGSELVSALGPGLARAAGTARRRRRFEPDPAAGGLRARGVSLVFGATTHPVVVAGSAHGAVSR